MYVCIKVLSWCSYSGREQRREGVIKANLEERVTFDSTENFMNETKNYFCHGTTQYNCFVSHIYH